MRLRHTCRVSRSAKMAGWAWLAVEKAIALLVISGISQHDRGPRDSRENVEGVQRDVLEYFLWNIWGALLEGGRC